MHSILQKDKEHCFLCGKNRNFEPLDKHHVFEGQNRDKSEKYGLFVYIHHNSCHIDGDKAVHHNAEVANKLKAYAQKKAMEYYGMTEKDFRDVFGKSWI